MLGAPPDVAPSLRKPICGDLASTVRSFVARETTTVRVFENFEYSACMCGSCVAQLELLLRNLLLQLRQVGAVSSILLCRELLGHD